MEGFKGEGMHVITPGAVEMRCQSVTKLEKLSIYYVETSLIRIKLLVSLMYPYTPEMLIVGWKDNCLAKDLGNAPHIINIFIQCMKAHF